MRLACLRYFCLSMFLASVAICMPPPAQAQSTSPLLGASQRLDADPKPMLTVGVYLSPPFTMVDETGRYSGMAVDLWHAIEESLGFRSHFFQYSTLNDILAAAQADKVDVVLTNLSVTYERALYLYYSYPWYDSGLRVLVPTNNSASVLDQLKRSGQLKIFVWLGLGMLFGIAFMTIVRRRLDPKFESTWLGGMAHSLYDIVALAKAGRLETSYLGWFGHIVAAVWMICGVAIIAYVTSSITTAMTTVSLTSDIKSIHDLPGRNVGVFSGSLSETFIKNMGLKSTGFYDMEDASEALLDNKIQAIVADAPVLEYWAHNHESANVQVVGNIFWPDKYAFATGPGNGELMRQISLELIRLHQDGTIQALRRKYFGSM